MKIDNYKPDYLVEAVYQLDPKRLQALNVRAVMVDL
ncbi:MAG: YqeG family HAD IIIA-type phosphatase, partial [Lactococcus lactis]|nr:YqeG family HAD IIIA-type phosphatase [Lactococcus lactis]